MNAARALIRIYKASGRWLLWLPAAVYVNSMVGQAKAMIDRCMPCGDKLAGKALYFVAAASANRKWSES